MGIKMIIKSIGKVFFSAIMINSVLIPLIVFFVAKNGNEYNVSFAVNILTQMFTPLLGSFVICMHMSKYIDSRGNEIFYVINKGKEVEVIKLFIAYALSNTFPFLFYMILNRNMGLEWIHIIIITWLFMSVSYFLCFLLRSVSLAVIPFFIYTIYSIVGFSFLGKKISYYEVEGVTTEDLMSKYIIFLIVSVVIFILGNALNIHYDKFNE